MYIHVYKCPCEGLCGGLYLGTGDRKQPGMGSGSRAGSIYADNVSSYISVSKLM